MQQPALAAGGGGTDRLRNVAKQKLHPPQISGLIRIGRVGLTTLQREVETVEGVVDGRTRLYGIDVSLRLLLI